ncbi:hypothetical protein V5799_017095 [Amblyomma americanum]|uniref:Secreted protein n=1 Tax=Amblyomma americanum TaxID=6943 RepID=A0AAQ4F4F6_AMBAM
MPSTMRSNLALATLLTGFLWTQGISEELPCDVKASYTCFWDISTKFRKAVEDTGDVLSAACSITKELPTKNKCESLYVGCMDDEKKQFLTMESGYASLHNITADNRTCTRIWTLTGTWYITGVVTKIIDGFALPTVGIKEPSAVFPHISTMFTGALVDTRETAMTQQE